MILPPWPDAATLAVLPYWAAGGAAAGFGAVLIRWLMKRGIQEPPIHIPGAPEPRDPAPTPFGPSGLLAAVLGSAMATLWAWGWYGPEEAMQRIGVIFAVTGVVQAVWHVLRVTRDSPAVGEQPSVDPEQTAASRLPGAWGGVAMAGLGVVMALF